MDKKFPHISFLHRQVFILYI